MGMQRMASWYLLLCVRTVRIQSGTFVDVGGDEDLSLHSVGVAMLRRRQYMKVSIGTIRLADFGLHCLTLLQLWQHD